jgi:hypothetical protein
LPQDDFQKKDSTFIECECGFKILLVPDLKIMTKAIEAHAAQHGKNEKDPIKAASEQERIENILVAKTLKGASELY